MSWQRSTVIWFFKVGKEIYSNNMRWILNDIYKIFLKQIYRTYESNNFIFTGYIYLVLDKPCTIVSSILDHCTLVNNIKEINWFTMAFMQIDWWIHYSIKSPFQYRNMYQCDCLWVFIFRPNFLQYSTKGIESFCSNG